MVAYGSRTSEPRDTPVTIRVTASERRRYEAAASSAGVTLSDWMRRSLDAAAAVAPARFMTEEEEQALRDASTAVNMAGSVVNQLVRHLTFADRRIPGYEWPEASRLRAAADDVAKLRERMQRVLAALSERP